MRQVVVNVDESKYNFFLELLGNLNFIEIEDSGDDKQDILDNVKQGLQELKQYKSGEIQFRNASELIDEL